MSRVMDKEARLEVAREGLAKAQFDLAALNDPKFSAHVKMFWGKIYQDEIRAWQDTIAELGGNPTEEEKK